MDRRYNISMSPTVPIFRSLVRYRRCGWVISFLVHAALAVGLVAGTFQPWWAAGHRSRNARTIRVAMAAEEPVVQAAPEVRMVSDPADVTAAVVRKRLDEVVAESEAMPEADKLAQLDVLSGRLKDVADEQSLHRLSGVMHSFLGTKPRAMQPAQEKPHGEFDFDTAQLHDIQRHPKEPAGFRYITVLLDAEGRTVEVEVSEQDGQLIYETMQRIKANPPLEQVYRQIVIPLLDQLMAGIKQAQPDSERAAP
jgi:hypothetical protein